MSIDEAALTERAPPQLPRRRALSLSRNCPELGTRSRAGRRLCPTRPARDLSCFCVIKAHHVTGSAVCRQGALTCAFTPCLGNGWEGQKVQSKRQAVSLCRRDALTLSAISLARTALQNDSWLRARLGKGARSCSAPSSLKT